MHRRGTAGLLMVATLLTGCTSDGPDESTDVGPDARWRTSSEPVETRGLAWAAGSVVHLPDGSTIDAGDPVGAFAVGGDGVFFVRAEDAGDGVFRDAELRFATPGGHPGDTGLDVDSEGFRISPDGAHLAVLDVDRDDGTAEMRVFNLSSGEVATSRDGMRGDSDDPVDDLLESEVEILGIDEDAVFARTVQGDYSFDLSTGEGRELGQDADVPGADPLVSPDGRWTISRPAGLRDVLVRGSGADLVPRTGSPRWTLSGWLDASSVIGVSIGGPGEGSVIGPDNTLALMICAVPSGVCEPVEGTTGEEVVLPLGTGVTSRIDLTPRQAS